MVQNLTKEYANVAHDVIYIHKSLWTECQHKRKQPTIYIGTVVRPILTKNFGSGSQDDLIDMQAMTQGNYKFIMVH